MPTITPYRNNERYLILNIFNPNTINIRPLKTSILVDPNYLIVKMVFLLIKFPITTLILSKRHLLSVKWFHNLMIYLFVILRYQIYWNNYHINRKSQKQPVNSLNKASNQYYLTTASSTKIKGMIQYLLTWILVDNLHK